MTGNCKSAITDCSKILLLKSKKIAFITDREPALTKAVLKHFPWMQVLHCWDLLKRDFKEELRKLGEDQSVYLSDWRQMAQSENIKDFNSTCEELTSKWSANVKVYFDKGLSMYVLHDDWSNLHTWNCEAFVFICKYVYMFNTTPQKPTTTKKH